MRTFLVLLLAMAAACAPAPSRPREESDVRCTLVKFDPMSNPSAEVRTWVARVRVTNGGPTAIEYRGWAPDSPIFEQEVQKDGAWQRVPVGWCGTGLVDQRLEPGASIELDFAVPADGNLHRFRFGDPAVVTAALRAPGP